MLRVKRIFYFPPGVFTLKYFFLSDFVNLIPWKWFVFHRCVEQTGKQQSGSKIWVLKATHSTRDTLYNSNIVL